MKSHAERIWLDWKARLQQDAAVTPAYAREPTDQELQAECTHLAATLYVERHPLAHCFLIWCDEIRADAQKWPAMLAVCLLWLPDALVKRHRRVSRSGMQECAVRATKSVYAKLGKQYKRDMNAIQGRVNQLDRRLEGKWQWIEDKLVIESLLMWKARAASTATCRGILDSLEHFADQELDSHVAVRRSGDIAHLILEELRQQSPRVELKSTYIKNGTRTLAASMVNGAEQGDFLTRLAACRSPTNMKGRDIWLVLWTALAASVDFTREKAGLDLAETVFLVAWIEKWQFRMAAWPQSVCLALGVKSPADFGSFHLTIADKKAEGRSGADGILLIWDKRTSKGSCRVVSIQAKIVSPTTLSVKQDGWRQFETLKRTSQENGAGLYLGLNPVSDVLFGTIGIPLTTAVSQFDGAKDGTDASGDAVRGKYGLAWQTCGQPFATALVETLFDPDVPVYSTPSAALKAVADSTGITVWDVLLIQGIGIDAQSIKRALSTDLELLKACVSMYRNCRTWSEVRRRRGENSRAPPWKWADDGASRST